METPYNRGVVIPVRITSQKGDFHARKEYQKDGYKATEATIEVGKKKVRLYVSPRDFQPGTGDTFNRLI